MGRIGKLPIKVPANVQVEINQNTVQVSGPQGKLFRTISELISVELLTKYTFIFRINFFFDYMNHSREINYKTQHPQG